MDDLLPQKVTWCKQKKGFLAPTRRWLDRHKPEAEDLLYRTQPQLTAFVKLDVVIREYDTLPYKMLWRIVNMAKWLEAFTPRIDV